MKQVKVIFLLCLLLSQNQLLAQALHWLSQPNGQLGQEQNASHSDVHVSANGRYISFISLASNVVAGDTNQRGDLFVYDSITESVVIGSEPLDENGINQPSLHRISAPTSDGQWVAFTGNGDYGFNSSSQNRNLYLKNLQTGDLELLSLNNSGNQFNANEVHLSDDASNVYFITSENLDPKHTTADLNLYRKNLNDDSYVLLSVAADGLTAADSDIDDFAVSNNGRYIAFNTEATNLTALGTVGDNIYLIDTINSTIGLITVKPDGSPTEDDENIRTPNIAVSDTGSVAFVTKHNDLVTGDNNDRNDLFLFDGTTNRRINLNEGGIVPATSFPRSVILSADGSQLIFTDNVVLTSNDSNNNADIYAYNTTTASMALITNPNATNNDPVFKPQTNSQAVSADGTKLFFTSSVIENTTASSHLQKIFSYDFNNQNTTHINPVAVPPTTTNDSVLNPKISRDQMSVIYASNATNLTQTIQTNGTNDLFLLDREDNTHSLIAENISRSDYAISPSGRFLTYRVNHPSQQVVLYDRNFGTEVQIANGSNVSVNDLGVVVFESDATLTAEDKNDFSDIYLYEPEEGAIYLISTNVDGNASNGDSQDAKIAGLGDDDLVVVFASDATDLITDDSNQETDIFLHQWPSGITIRISQNAMQKGGNAASMAPNISYKANFISFLSEATDLTEDDYTNSNGNQGFIYERDGQNIELISLNTNNLPLNLPVTEVSVSDSGRYLAYTTIAQVLPEDFGFRSDIYLFDRTLSETKLISKLNTGSQSYEFFRNPTIVENEEFLSPLIGVAFNGQGDLTGVAEHPAHNEAFLYQQGGPDINLNIVINGMGSVSGSQVASCMTDCDYSYALGTDLTLNASPDVGYIFDRWQSSFGQCADETNPCNLTMNRDKQITATFIDENDIIFKNGF